MRPSGDRLNRDRLVAHRRIDLICDENTDSNSVGTKGSFSSMVNKDRSRKKSDSGFGPSSFSKTSTNL